MGTPGKVKRRRSAPAGVVSTATPAAARPSRRAPATTKPKSKRQDKGRPAVPKMPALEETAKAIREASDSSGSDGEENAARDLPSLPAGVDAERLRRDLVEAVREMTEKAANPRSLIQAQMKKLEAGDLETAEGLSFLEAKNHLLLLYNLHLAFYFLLKLEGKSVEGHPVVERLIRLRTTLERIRPIDAKLKYQVDKLVRLAATGAAEDVKDALSFKPNLSRLAAKVDEEKEDSTGVYQAPKISATPYEEEERNLSKQEKLERKEKSRLLRSSIVSELREEMSSAPREVKEREGAEYAHLKRARRAGRLQDADDRRRYEEANFTRLAVSKKNRQKQARLRSELDDIAHFGNVSDITSKADDISQGILTKSKSMREQIGSVKRPARTSRKLKPSKRFKADK